MILLRYIVGLLLIAFCSSCAASKHFCPYGEIYPATKDTVKIISQVDSIPSSCIRIGDLHIYDAGFASQCGYEEVLNQAKMETNARGGNVFKVTRVSTPSIWTSTCYRIRGEVLLCK